MTLRIESPTVFWTFIGLIISLLLFANGQLLIVKADIAAIKTQMDNKVDKVEFQDFKKDVEYELGVQFSCVEASSSYVKI